MSLKYRIFKSIPSKARRFLGFGLKPIKEAENPVEKSKTMYDVFIPKSTSKDSNSVKTNGMHKKQEKTAPAKKKKGDQEKKESKANSVMLVVELLDKNDLQEVFDKSHNKFPENPDVWLKDLASFLNVRFEKVPETDAVFKGESKDFPLCKMSKSCQEVLVQSIKKCSEQTQEHLLYHCVQKMLDEMTKGRPTYGYRMFIQVLAYHRPELPLSKFPQYLDLLKTHQSRPLRCLAILWALGQSGVKRLRCGLKVWLSLMLPALGVRSVATFCTEYLEDLFSWHKDLKPAFGSVSMRDYFQVLDILFVPSHNIQADLKKRLQTQYPKILTIAFGENPSKNLRSFFPSYLSRAVPTCENPLKQELLSCLVRCLITDKASFSTWCQMYTKHLPQSSVLLKHISDDWDKHNAKFDKKMLRETLRSFSVTNEETASQSQKVQEGHAECDAACKELLLKLSRSAFPWFSITMIIMLTLGAVIAYDVWPGFRNSRTEKFLKNYGILAVLEQAWKKIQTFFSNVFDWMEQNVPAMYAFVYEKVGPALSGAWRTVNIWVAYAIDASKPHREWIVVKTGEACEWIYNLSPDFWNSLGNMLWVCWEFVLTNTLWLWKYMLHIASHVYDWLLKNIGGAELSLDKIYETVVWCFVEIQNYIAAFFTWCSSLLSEKSEQQSHDETAGF